MESAKVGAAGYTGIQEVDLMVGHHYKSKKASMVR